MGGTIIATFETVEQAGQAAAALRRAGVPDASLHHGDDAARPLESPSEDGDGSLLWTAMFGIDEPLEHVGHDAPVAAGDTVVRVAGIPAQHHQAVLAILARRHPADMRILPAG